MRGSTKYHEEIGHSLYGSTLLPPRRATHALQLFFQLATFMTICPSIIVLPRFAWCYIPQIDLFAAL